MMTSEIALDATETGVSNATEIKLAAEGSINTETTESSVLTGEALAGTSEAPAELH